MAKILANIRAIRGWMAYLQQGGIVLTNTRVIVVSTLLYLIAGAMGVVSFHALGRLLGSSQEEVWIASTGLFLYLAVCWIAGVATLPRRPRVDAGDA